MTLVRLIVAIAVLMVFVAVIAVPISCSMPHNWKAQGNGCKDAGKRRGTDKDAWCISPDKKGCVPCPRSLPAAAPGKAKKPDPHDHR